MVLANLTGLQRKISQELSRARTLRISSRIHVAPSICCSDSTRCSRSLLLERQARAASDPPGAAPRRRPGNRHQRGRPCRRGSLGRCRSPTDQSCRSLSPLSSSSGCSVGSSPSLSLRPRHRRLGKQERLEHRHAAVLVRVDLLARQRVNEVAAEQRRIVLRPAARRGDDRPAGRGQVVDERAAGARCVHEHDLPGRQALELRVEVGAGHVRPGQVEFRRLPVVAAVPDQHDVPRPPPSPASRTGRTSC